MLARRTPRSFVLHRALAVAVALTALVTAGVPATAGAVPVAPQFGAGAGSFPSLAFNAPSDRWAVVRSPDDYVTLIGFAGFLTSSAPVGPTVTIGAEWLPGNELSGRLDIDASTDRAEFLVVFQGAGDVRGQLLRADGGVGPPFTIAAGGSDPSVAYLAARREFLVAWTDRTHVYARRVSATGAPLGSTVRVSNRDPVNVEPDVVAGPGGGYLVVWEARAPDRASVVGQRLTSLGTTTGPDDFAISSHTNLTGQVANQTPAAAYNPATRETYVVWSDTYEIFGQRLDANLARVGSNARVSDMGPDGDPFYRTWLPSIAYQPRAGRYLVAWEGIDLPGSASFKEIFGQHLTGAGGSIGPNDFRISACADYSGNVAVSPDPRTREYLVVWDTNADDCGHGAAGTVVVARRVVAP